jgi:hypothetical protein
MRSGVSTEVEQGLTAFDRNFYINLGGGRHLVEC